MKALSIMQPWASLIAFGVKLIENRSWRPSSMIGESFAIHASAKRDMDAFADLRDGVLIDKDEWPFPYATVKDFPTGALLGTARIVTYVTNAYQIAEYTKVEQGRWYTGEIGFVLADVRRIDPITDVKGALGFWQLSDAHEAELVERLRRTA